MKIYPIALEHTRKLLQLQEKIKDLNAEFSKLKQSLMNKAQDELPLEFQDRPGYSGTTTKPDMSFTEDFKYICTRNAK